MRSFAIASRRNALEMVSSRASKLSTVIQTLPYTPSLLAAAGSSAIIGVRKRNSTPCAKNMTIAGQRETSASLRPRQNSNAVSQT